jgi:glyoxylase-like metal-dependent hydrolase (beta-lactamase superfamily II)
MSLTVHTLDLNFQGSRGSTAAYAIRHARGAVLVECGPGSTLPALQASLRSIGLSPSDISDVLLTHIHLDHGGSAGWWARQGATIHVHPVGAPHLLNPEKLLASAQRIYGDAMQRLWGEFLPVPQDKLHIAQDQQEIVIEGLRFCPLDTPGHANHHFAYVCEDVCFMGDVGGVRFVDTRHIRLPTPPPEVNLEAWLDSVRRLQPVNFKRIAPTHCGVYDDATWHLQRLEQIIHETGEWLAHTMATNPSPGEFIQHTGAWLRGRCMADDLSPEQIALHEITNGAVSSANGLWRYWTKRQESKSRK